MPLNQPDSSDILKTLGAKPSRSEENGLNLIEDNKALTIFSPGISTAGFAEIRMAQANPNRKIVATTIDEKGLSFADAVIKEQGLDGQIETSLEDLRNVGVNPDNFFDFIYARLVLHYLSAEDLDIVLADFYRIAKSGAKLFIVVRSVKNIPNNVDNEYDPKTRLTTIRHKNDDGSIRFTEIRYFHTPQSIQEHLQKAGFTVASSKEYQEQLYKDFMRREISPILDHVIEIQAFKS